VRVFSGGGALRETSSVTVTVSYSYKQIPDILVRCLVV
jgi:hypothetical protein